MILPVYTMTNSAATTLFLIVGFLIDTISGDYCWYIHEDYYIRQTVYCSNGCCRDYGEPDEICCFEWTVGIILGICFAIITVVAALIALVICCVMAKKKRARTGVLLSTNNSSIATHTFVHSGSSNMYPYSYPHPPSGFYPASQFPNAPPQPIPSTITNKDSNPAYPPPPSYSQAMPPSYGQATAPPQPSDIYGGYGRGAS